MINCIAIDDEPLALKQIASYINKTPFLELTGQFDNAIEALGFLQNIQVDLMFVDINMPDMSGMDFVKSLENAPKVIFTTAYSEYAVEGFKVDAMDYLLKPLDYATFLKSANKAQTYFDGANKINDNLKANKNHLFIKSEYKIIRIELNTILYVEGMREYVRIHIENQNPVMTLMSMKKMEEYLPTEKFMRVHRSFIVNLDKVTTIERNRIVFDGKTYIPVSEQYKTAFQDFLNKNFLV